MVMINSTDITELLGGAVESFMSSDPDRTADLRHQNLIAGLMDIVERVDLKLEEHGIDLVDTTQLRAAFNVGGADSGNALNTAIAANAPAPTPSEGFKQGVELDDTGPDFSKLA